MENVDKETKKEIPDIQMIVKPGLTILVTRSEFMGFQDSIRKSSLACLNYVDKNICD